MICRVPVYMAPDLSIPARHAIMAALTYTTPAIVGVPCFLRWASGPSSLTSWPNLMRLTVLMNQGIRSTVIRNERPAISAADIILFRSKDITMYICSENRICVYLF